jgi:hypothetical protein
LNASLADKDLIEEEIGLIYTGDDWGCDMAKLEVKIMNEIMENGIKNV